MKSYSSLALSVLLMVEAHPHDLDVNGVPLVYPIEFG